MKRGINIYNEIKSLYIDLESINETLKYEYLTARSCHAKDTLLSERAKIQDEINRIQYTWFYDDNDVQERIAKALAELNKETQEENKDDMPS